MKRREAERRMLVSINTFTSIGVLSHRFHEIHHRVVGAQTHAIGLSAHVLLEHLHRIDGRIHQNHAIILTDERHPVTGRQPQLGPDIFRERDLPLGHHFGIIDEGHCHVLTTFLQTSNRFPTFPTLILRDLHKKIHPVEGAEVLEDPAVDGLHPKYAIESGTNRMSLMHTRPRISLIRIIKSIQETLIGLEELCQSLRMLEQKRFKR